VEILSKPYGIRKHERTGFVLTGQGINMSKEVKDIDVEAGTCNKLPNL
jgi:hypothetical protein